MTDNEWLYDKKEIRNNGKIKKSIAYLMIKYLNRLFWLNIDYVRKLGGKKLCLWAKFAFGNLDGNVSYT